MARPTTTTTDPSPGPLPGWMSWLAVPLAALYSVEINRRNRAYDRADGVTRLDRRVVSVGNLTAGGTGKTPVVAWAVRQLLDAGRRPCVAMRGYKSRGGISDESALHLKGLGGAPVVAQPDRTAGLRALFTTAEGRGVDTVVLDDGFQHRRLARDADIVLVDATTGTLDGRLLPAGWLREPPASLARADAVVLTHAEATNPDHLRGLAERVRALAPGVPVTVARHAWAALRVHRGVETSEENVGWLAGQRPMAVCAIGNPRAFVGGVQRAAGSLAGSVVRRDHDPYEPGTVRAIAARARAVDADAIVTTEKDWVKLGRAPADAWPCPVVVPRLEIRIDEGEDTLRNIVLGGT